MYRKAANARFLSQPQDIDQDTVVTLTRVYRDGDVWRESNHFAYENHTLESVVKQLAKEGIEYRPSVPRFSRTSVHNMLTDRAYIGEVRYRGQ